MEHNNEGKWYIQQGLCSTSVLIISGTIMQTFLLESGIQSHLVSTYVSAMLIVQVAVMILSSKKIEKVRNILRVTALVQFFQVALLGTFFLLCFVHDIQPEVKYIAVFVIGIIVNAALGIYNVISYKLPYHIIDMHRYGHVLGVSGILSGIVGIVFSVVITAFLEKYEYFSVMKIFLPISFMFPITSGICTLLFKEKQYIEERNDDSKSINLFTYKPFLQLFVPNLFRGFTCGIFNIMATVGYHCNLLNSVTAGYLLVITNASMIMSCFCYSIIAKKHIEKWIILFSSICIAILMPIMFAGKSAYVFLTVYGIGYFVVNLVNYSVPIAVVEIVDYDVIGQYSAWRMMLNTLGTAIAGFVCIPMIDIMGVMATFIIAGLMQFASGISYFLCMKSCEVRKR